MLLEKKEKTCGRKEIRNGKLKKQFFQNELFLNSTNHLII